LIQEIGKSPKKIIWLDNTKNKACITWTIW
jgi:hypothetical protein